jgi:putative salt-induced outer membrane protein
MRMTTTRLLAFLLFISAQCVFAEEVPQTDKNQPPKEAVWKANIEFGYVATSGNTDTTTVNTAVSITHEVETWRNSLEIVSIFGSAENDTTSQVETNAERYFIQGKTDYKYTEASYAFVLANYDDDRFSDNDYQTSVSAGRGFGIITGDTSKLDLELGIGYRKTQKKETLLLAKETINETIYRLAEHFVWDISKNSKFEQKLSADIGDENTVTKFSAGLSANVAESLALKLSLTATHQSDVRGDTEQLDTITAFTLVYNF